MTGPLETLKPSEIAVGDALPPLELDMTPSLIVAGALASRDFMPVHHDVEFARSRGAPGIFMNIHTTNGYLSRFVTDWAGPECRVRTIRIRLGATPVAGEPLRFSGEVTGMYEEADECVIEVAVRAANRMGDTATGTVVASVPL